MKEKPDKILTLCLVCRDSKVLLALKKSRFGAGLINGYGGKVREGREIEDEAKRELKTESGLLALKMRQIGFLLFKFLDTGKVFECHLFRVDKSKGVPKETKEMGQPHWYQMDMKSIPFGQMWEGDKFWFPFFLRGEDFHGWILYNNKEDKKAINHKIAPA